MKHEIFLIPNLLTILRILLIPVFLFLLWIDDPRYRLGALLIFTFASITDFLDGYLARRLSQDSKLGRFLDPLADKFLVIATLIAFLYLDNLIPLWMVLTIIARDLLITFMRYAAIRRGVELRTTRLAKAKTAFQMTSIILIMMIFFVRSFHLDIQKTFEDAAAQGKTRFQVASELLGQAIAMLGDKEVPRKLKQRAFAESVPYFLMLFTTIITVISGVRYLLFNWQVLLPAEPGTRTGRSGEG